MHGAGTCEPDLTPCMRRPEFEELIASRQPRDRQTLGQLDLDAAGLRRRIHSQIRQSAGRDSYSRLARSPGFTSADRGRAIAVVLDDVHDGEMQQQVGQWADDDPHVRRAGSVPSAHRFVECRDSGLRRCRAFRYPERPRDHGAPHRRASTSRPTSKCRAARVQSAGSELAERRVRRHRPRRQLRKHLRPE